jgi:hypothetical protein
MKKIKTAFVTVLTLLSCLGMAAFKAAPKKAITAGIISVVSIEVATAQLYYQSNITTLVADKSLRFSYITPGGNQTTWPHALYITQQYGLFIHPLIGTHFDSIGSEASFTSPDQFLTVNLSNKGRLHRSAKADISWDISNVTGLQSWIDNDALVTSDTNDFIMTASKAGQTEANIMGVVDSKADTADLNDYYLAGNPNGYISGYTETDPLSLHLSDTAIAFNPYGRKINYYDKTASDARYLLTSQQYALTAGEGIVVSGSSPTQTVSVDTAEATAGNSAIMYVGKANGAIGQINSDIAANTAAIATKQATLVSGTNIKTINGNTILGSGNLVVGGGTVSSVGITSTDFTMSGSPITTSGNITANLTATGVSAGTYDWVTVDAKGRVTAAGNPVVDTISTARIMNTAYRISTTGNTDINVCFSISCNLSLSGGQAGEVYLETSSDGITNWQRRGMIPASNTGSLTVGLNTTQVSGGQLSALLPAGWYWRLRTNNTTGTPTYTFLGGNKISY